MISIYPSAAKILCKVQIEVCPKEVLTCVTTRICPREFTALKVAPKQDEEKHDSFEFL